MLGSVTLSYSLADMYEGTDTDMVRLFYSRQLFKNSTLTITASRTDADEVSDSVFANLIFYLGGRTSASFTYANQDGLTSEGINVQKTPPLGTGFSYRVHAERKEVVTEDREINSAAFVQYRGPFGIYSLNARRVSETDSYMGLAAGGLAYIDRSLHFSRPITDSFALVDVPDLENVKVFYNNQEVGVTDSAGELLVPELQSYYRNKLSIEAKDIPINYEIKETQQNVSIPFRGGGVVQFDVKKFQAFIGKIFFRFEGEKISADYAGLEIQAEGANVEGIVGKGSEFYLENLAPGKFQARAYLEDKECRFEITIPKSNAIMVDLGEIICEVD